MKKSAKRFQFAIPSFHFLTCASHGFSRPVLSFILVMKLIIIFFVLVIITVTLQFGVLVNTNTLSYIVRVPTEYEI